MADNFYDTFGGDEQRWFNNDDFEDFRRLVLDNQGHSIEELQQRYQELVMQKMIKKQLTQEDKKAAFKKDPYVLASVNLETFQRLVNTFQRLDNEVVAAKNQEVPEGEALEEDAASDSNPEDYTAE